MHGWRQSWAWICTSLLSNPFCTATLPLSCPHLFQQFPTRRGALFTRIDLVLGLLDRIRFTQKPESMLTLPLTRLCLNVGFCDTTVAGALPPAAPSCPQEREDTS